MKKSQREETFYSPNNLTKWKEGETFLVGIFKKGVVKKKRLFCNFSFSFLVKTFEKEQTGDEKK